MHYLQRISNTIILGIPFREGVEESCYLEIPYFDNTGEFYNVVCGQLFLIIRKLTISGW